MALRDTRGSQTVGGSAPLREILAMKTLSGWEAARCDEHQFRAKIKVST